jgi:hypothetical protein
MLDNFRFMGVVQDTFNSDFMLQPAYIAFKATDSDVEILDIVYSQQGGDNTAELVLCIFLNWAERVEQSLKIHVTIGAELPIPNYYKEFFHANCCDVLECEMHHLGNL